MLLLLLLLLLLVEQSLHWSALLVPCAKRRLLALSCREERRKTFSPRPPTAWARGVELVAHSRESTTCCTIEAREELCKVLQAYQPFSSVARFARKAGHEHGRLRLNHALKARNWTKKPAHNERCAC